MGFPAEGAPVLLQTGVRRRDPGMSATGREGTRRQRDLKVLNDVPVTQ